MNNILLTIMVPLAAALLCVLFRRLAGWLALLASAFVVLEAALVFRAGGAVSPLFALQAFPFTAGIFLAAAVFTLLVVIYSIGFITEGKRSGEYYAYVLITLACAAGVLFASDFLTLILCWGTLGIPLYMLVGIADQDDGSAAKKTLLIVGGADALMIIGIGIIWLATGSLQIGSTHLPLNTPLMIAAFLALLAGAFAKAGVMPLHSWIPEAAACAPAPVMAFLPASIDKLLGIYLLSRLCYDVFIIRPNSPLAIGLLAIGSVTIIGAVLAALVQHDLKKLLSFHAVSQVGYMVLGLGTGLPLGVAGGIFHMFNHAIYKSCLFLCAGTVEARTGTTELAKLGGLGKKMPLTFAAFLIAAFSISGLPPLNGFVSKWMIYSSVIQLAGSSNWWIVWLAAAMFGSAFTLASFVKVIQAVFLGQGSEFAEKAKEGSAWLWLPTVFLAAVCVIFGLWAFALPIRYLVAPAIAIIPFSGIWEPGPATLLLLTGLAVGLAIYLLGNVRKVSERPAFYGGEELPLAEIKVTGTDFYDTVKRFKPLEMAYAAGEKHYFDLYEMTTALVRWLGARLFWLDTKQPFGLIGWFRRDRAFATRLLIALVAAELLVEGLLLLCGVRELLTTLTALAAVAVTFFLTARLSRSYANE
ncbi:MAG: complex I subunit 5 family protein [Candidatus Margulisiibacteriota bacterium]